MIQMIPTPIHHPDEKRPLSPMQIRRIPWRTALPWGLLALSLLISLGLGLWVQQLRVEQRSTRSLAATNLWIELSELPGQSERVLQAAERDDLTTTISRLRTFRDAVARTGPGAGIYRQTLALRETDRSVPLSPLVVSYAIGISHLADTIEEQQAIEPEQQAILRALQADMHLITTLFSRDVLMDGTAADLTQASTQLCQQMQVSTLAQWTTDMDGCPRQDSQ